VIELRFHREIYTGEAVDEAIKRLARFAAFDRVAEPTHWVVRVTAHKPARERQIAGELANHALGLTADRRRPDAPRSPR
jgi:hypothetical protein